MGALLEVVRMKPRGGSSVCRVWKGLDRAARKIVVTAHSYSEEMESV